MLSAFLRFFSAFLLCGTLEYLTQGRRNARLRLALLRRAVHRADVAVDDADALVGAAGVFLRPLAYLYPLDEQPQQLRRQLVDGGVLLCLLNECIHVGGGGFQFKLPDMVRRANGPALFAVGVALEIVLRLFHCAGSVQHQRLAAIRAEHQPGEDVRLVHVLGDTLFVLTHLLHDVPLLLCDKSFVGVLHHEPLTFRALHTLLVFVGDRSGAKPNRVSEVDLIVQNAGDAVGRPQAGSGRVQSPVAFPGLAVVGVGRVHHLFLGEDGGDPLGAVSSGTEGEDALHHKCGVLVRNQRVGVTITFPIAVGRSAAQPLSLLRFHFHDRADLAAGILGVKLVGPVADGVEVIAALHCGIHAIVDSDEADILLGKIYLHVIAHLKVFTPQAGGVLYDEVRHLSRFDHLHDLFPRWPLEVRTRVAVIRKEDGVLEALFFCVFLQQGALR